MVSFFQNKNSKIIYLTNEINNIEANKSEKKYFNFIYFILGLHVLSKMLISE